MANNLIDYLGPGRQAWVVRPGALAHDKAHGSGLFELCCIERLFKISRGDSPPFYTGSVRHT